MFEHAVYSVISPEGCASILWRSSDKAETASEALRLTAADMMQLGIIDQIVDEPVGGAHRDVEAALLNMSDAIEQELSALSTLSPDELRANRRDKYVAMGEKSLA